jgi:hypothetical protein
MKRPRNRPVRVSVAGAAATAGTVWLTEAPLQHAGVGEDTIGAVPLAGCTALVTGIGAGIGVGIGATIGMGAGSADTTAARRPKSRPERANSGRFMKRRVRTVVGATGVPGWTTTAGAVPVTTVAGWAVAQGVGHGAAHSVVCTA